MTRPLTDIPILSGASPLSGHATEFRVSRYTLFDRVAREQNDFVRLRMVALPVICPTTPDGFHEILVDKWKSFAKTVGIRTLLFPLAGDGLFTSDGELWRRQRKLMAPLFSPAHLEVYVQGMVECIQRWADRLSDGEVIEVDREMTRLTMNIVSRALFDADTDGEARELGDAIGTVLSYIAAQAGTVGFLLKMQSAAALEGLDGDFPPALARARSFLLDTLRHPLPLPTEASRRLREAFDTLYRLVDRMISDRRRTGLSRPDLLTKLLATRDEDDGSTMSDRQVRDEVLTLFFAGHETTAVALTWALFLLSQERAAKGRLEDEVLSLPNDPSSARDLPNLAYTLRFVKETLRLYPPAFMFDRVAKEDVEVGGYFLPRGTNVFLFPYAMHRRQELFPDPERFDPDRFLPEAEKSRHRLSYLPFGAGPRICVGMHFALMEAQLALATIVRRFTLTPLNAERVVPGDRATLRPAEPLRMRVNLRVR